MSRINHFGCPKELSPRSKALWRAVKPCLGNDPPRLILLIQALESLDLEAACKSQIAAEGLMVKTPTGVARPHLLLSVARAAGSDFSRVWKTLGLDLAVDDQGDVDQDGGGETGEGW